MKILEEYVIRAKSELDEQVDLHGESNGNQQTLKTKGRYTVLKLLDLKFSEQTSRSNLYDFLDKIYHASKLSIEESRKEYEYMKKYTPNNEELKNIFDVRYYFNCGMLEESEIALDMMEEESY